MARCCLLITVFACLVAAPQVSARTVLQVTYHVAPEGSDGQDGSESAPWATLQHAAGRVLPGDTVLVHDGAYTGFQIERGGSPERPIVIKAAGTEAVIHAVNPVRGRDNVNVEGADYVVIEGFRVHGAERAGIRVVTARGVVVRNNVVGPNGRWGIFTGFAPDVHILDNRTFGSADEHGIYVSNSDAPGDRPVIRGNESYDNQGNGIQLNGDCHAGGDGVIEGAVIENNVVHGNRFKGLSLISIAATVVQNNLIYGNGLAGGAGGVHLVDEPGCGLPTTATVVVNNTIVEPRIAGIRATDGATENVVFNNLIVSDQPIRDEVGGNRVDAVSNLTAASPAGLFVDASARDYHLAAGSPARDAGVAAYENAVAPGVDLDGVVRPRGRAPDVGAYEAPAVSTRREDAARAPGAYHFSLVYPNPFGASTRFTLAVTQPQRVRLVVYDLLGRAVTVLHDGPLAPGRGHSFSFEAGALPGGTYLVRATGATFAGTRRAVRIR